MCESECIRMILTRRSVREYSQKNVEDEKIKIILKAAMQAPSSRNSQPWHFIVVKKREILDEMARIHPYGKMLHRAKAAIVVCADPKLNKSRKMLWPQDCAAATQNILLASRCLGIGSVWLGVYPYEDRMRGIAELLGIPEDIVVFSVVSLGYPLEENAFYEAENRYKKDRIHWDSW